MKLFEVTNTTRENLQIATHKSVQCAEWTLICALQFADFLRLCLSPRTTSRTIFFSISNSFWYQFDAFFRYWLSTRCTLLGYTLLIWTTAWSQHCRCLYVALAGLSCFTAGCHVKSLPPPPPPQPPLKQRPIGVLNDGRKHKIVFFLQSNAVHE